MKLRVLKYTWFTKEEPPCPGALIQTPHRQFFVAYEDLYRVSDALVDIAEAYDNNNEKVSKNA